MLRNASVITVLAFVGCKDSKPPPKLVEVAPASNTTAGSGAVESLAYSVDAFSGTWQLSAHYTTPPASDLQMDVRGGITMRLATAAPGMLDVFLEELELAGTADGAPLDMTIKKGDPTHKVAFTTPLNTLSMKARGPDHGTPNPANPVAAQGANLIDSAVFLIPALPEGPVGIGATWIASRVVPKGSDAGADVVADIRYELASIGACDANPSARCAKIRFTADTGTKELVMGGQPAKVSYTFDGISIVQLGGALVSSEGRGTIALSVEGVTVKMTGELTCARL